MPDQLREEPVVGLYVLSLRHGYSFVHYFAKEIGYKPAAEAEFLWRLGTNGDVWSENHVCLFYDRLTDQNSPQAKEK